MAKVKVSSHRLIIETGRWSNQIHFQLPKVSLSCIIVYNEYHLTIECNSYNDVITL